MDDTVAKAEIEPTTNAETTIEPTFNKQSLIESDRFSEEVDVLNAVLEDGKMYTIFQVETAIRNFLKKGVK